MTVLMIEDNPVDVLLFREALNYTRILNELYVVDNGLEAMMFLTKQNQYVQSPRPDIIFLDLNLPGMNGTEILTKIKNDVDLRAIPVFIFSSSESSRDISEAYSNHANCYIRKPVDFDSYTKIVKGIYEFWFGLAEIPKNR